MTETNTTEVPAEEKTFGTDLRHVIAEYNKSVDYADTVRREAVDAAIAKINNATRAVTDLFGHGNVSQGISDLLHSLSAKDRNEKTRLAEEIRASVIEVARKKRDEALEADPFTKFVATYIQDNFGDSYVETLMENMPLTFDSLKELARSEDWCGSYESAMKEAVRRGALPDDKVEVRRSVDLHRVPFEYDAKEGEVWEHVFEVPAFVRTVDIDGIARSAYSLRDYRSNNRYERVSPAPETKDDESASED